MENQQTGEIFRFQGNEAKDFAIGQFENKEIDGETVAVAKVPAENFKRIKRIALLQRAVMQKAKKNRMRRKMAEKSRKDQR